MVPQVVGQDKDAARQALLDAGAQNVVFAYVNSDAPDGTVVAVDPAEGSPFVSADTITLSVAEPYVVPEVMGLSADAARAAVEKAANFTGLPITEVDSYQSAVALARETARPGDVVLLSPASTSFDRFANFMERGRVFKDLVNALK